MESRSAHLLMYLNHSRSDLRRGSQGRIELVKQGFHLAHVAPASNGGNVTTFQRHLFEARISQVELLPERSNRLGHCEYRNTMVIVHVGYNPGGSLFGYLIFVLVRHGEETRSVVCLRNKGE